MIIARTVNDLLNLVAKARENGKSIGLVPTMGALHDGHKALIQRARNENDFVIVSVFVNPTQFNNPDDLAKYPRTEEADIAMLESVGVDVAFMPSAEEVYGKEKDNRIFNLGAVAEVMEGAMRPGHFNGVAQIVSLLFEWTKPTRAYFGEKDFQQIAVIRKMAEDYGFKDIDIVACPIVREADGLALSSRNVRLSPQLRQAAPAIHRVLSQSLLDKEAGMTVPEVISSVTDKLNDIPNVEVEYYQISDAVTLQPISNWKEAQHPVGCIAVYFGDVRLIDNIIY